MASNLLQRVAKASAESLGWLGLHAKARAFVWILLLLSLSKLVLVADREIVGALRPHDDYWHIQAAAQWVWGRPFGDLTLAHLPTYAIYVATGRAIGLPLRISTEIVCLVCAAVLACSLGRIGLRRTIQVLVFALLIFHPFILEGLDFALPEMLFTCLTLAFVGLFIRLLVPTSRSDVVLNAVMFAIVSALMWYLRKESVLVGCLFCLVAIAIACAWFLKFIRRAEALGLAGRLVLSPLCAVLLFGAAISAANGLRYGLWNTDQLSAPNYKRMFSSLLSIRPERPIRFVAVTREVRDKAYAVSPTFRELRPYLDGSKEHWTASVTRTLGIGGGEIASGWFYWAMIDTVAAAGHLKTPADAEAFYGRAATEIEAALLDGRLPHRQAVLPYVDPSYSIWLPYFPESVVRLGTLLFPSNSPRYPDRTESTIPSVAANYDLTALRRKSVGNAQPFIAQGWVASSAGKPLEVQILGAGNRDIPFQFKESPRFDVKPFVDKDHIGPDPIGFSVSWRSEGAGTVRFRVRMEDGKFATSEPIGRLPQGMGIRLYSSDPETQVVLAVDRLDGPAPPTRTLVARSVQAIYPFLLGAFAAGALVYVVYLVLRRDLALGLPGLILLFVVAIVFSRVLFFAVLDSSAWSAEQTRYLLPAAILLPIIPAIILALRSSTSGGAQRR